MPQHLYEVKLRAQQTVANLVNALEAQNLVPNFLESYVHDFSRRELKNSPLRYRELLFTITRESLVAMAAKIAADLPRRVARRKSAKPNPVDLQAEEIFREEFFACVGRAMKWPPSELEEFQRDVELYAHMTAPRTSGNSARGNTRAAASKPAAKSAPSPFVDRCALLLDPSLLEKARESAVKFHAQLEKAAEKSLAAAFRSR